MDMFPCRQPERDASAQMRRRQPERDASALMQRRQLECGAAARSASLNYRRRVMFKRQIAIVLTAVLTLNLITACAGSGPKTESATGNTEDAAQTVGTQEAEDANQVSPVPGEQEDAAGGARAGDQAEGKTGTEAQQAGAGQSQQAGAGQSQQAAAGQTQQAGAGQTQQAGAGATGSQESGSKPKTAPHTVTGRPESDINVILPGFTYKQEAAQAVGGRQGIACGNGEYWVSGSNVLARYDKEWKLTATNADPFADLAGKADYLGDIDFHEGEIYACAERRSGGEAADPQIAVYDAQTLKLARVYSVNAQSGQKDCSGIAVDPDTQSIWTCSWTDGESGRYLYRYSLETGEYIGKIHMQAPPQWLRGIAYYKGYLYMAADDGTADHGEPDHIYRWRVDTDSTDACVTLERTLDDVEVVGEVGGLSLDKTAKKMLVVCNSGALIEQGKEKELYEGYDREIHEVYVYEMSRNAWPLDYSKDDMWVTKPDETAAEGAKADVFAVMPTVNMNMWTPDNEDITSLRDALRFKKTFNMEKGIFSRDTAIYSPYYRQCTLGVYTLPEGEEREQYRKTAGGDVRSAFRWYLDNCHKEGRPIVLFGFSQGAEAVYDLLVEFGQDARLSDNLAAAYVIGYGITQEDLNASPWLKMAQGEKDTGVIVSYDCMDQSAAKPEVKVLSINPLNWKTDSTPAEAKTNRGYVATDTYGNVRQEIAAFCGGYLDEKTGILIPTGIENPEKYAAKGIKVVPDGSYHFYDLIFFYNNLKENIGKRIKAFEDGKAAAGGAPKQDQAQTQDKTQKDKAGAADTSQPVAPVPENAGEQTTTVPDGKTGTDKETGTEKEKGTEKVPNTEEKTDGEKTPEAEEKPGEGVL